MAKELAIRTQNGRGYAWCDQDGNPAFEGHVEFEVKENVPSGTIDLSKDLVTTEYQIDLTGIVTPEIVATLEQLSRPCYELIGVTVTLHPDTWVKFFQRKYLKYGCRTIWHRMPVFDGIHLFWAENQVENRWQKLPIMVWDAKGRLVLWGVVLDDGILLIPVTRELQRYYGRLA